MSWKEFVAQWRPVDLTRLKISHRTVYNWFSGEKEPKGWQREAAEFWIRAKAGKPKKPGKANPPEKEK